MNPSHPGCQRFPAVLLALTVLVCGGVLAAAAPPGDPPARLVQPGPPQWRSLRRLWHASVTPVRSGRPISDLQVEGERLYYAGEDEVGCVAVSTGELLWRQSLVLPQTAGVRSYPIRLRRLAVTDGKLLLTESYAGMDADAAPPPYPVQAFEAATGKLIWKRPQSHRLWGRATVAAGTVLTATLDGWVLGLHSDDGAVLWQKQWARPRAGTGPALHVQGAGAVGVAQLGLDALIGFRVRDGRELWRVKAANPLGAQGISPGFSLSEGTVHAVLGAQELVAVDLVTGKRKWTRQETRGNLSSELPVVAGGRVITVAGSDHLLTALNGAGRTEWYRPRPEYEDPLPAGPLAAGGPLLLQLTAPPRLAAIPEPTRSLRDLDTLLALDPVSGQELWRWQPHEGTKLVQVLPAGDRILATDGERLYCFGPGAPPPLPAEAAARHQLAEQATSRLFGIPSPRVIPPGRFPAGDSGSNEARLTLLRLGEEAAPAVLAAARAQLEREGQRRPSFVELLDERETPFRNVDPNSALDLLVDLGDPRPVEELLALANELRNPLVLNRLVDALIRYGDPRAAPLLFRYARSESSNPLVRRGALLAACRAGNVPGLDQQEVTGYLLECLAVEKPRWLHQYAMFDLLNDRGELARAAALGAFRQEREARLLPADDQEVGDQPNGSGPFGFRKEGAVRDGQGTWWAVTASDFLGAERSDLWIARSTDGKHWFRPALLEELTLGSHWIRSVRVQSRGSALQVELTTEAWPQREQGRERRIIPLAPEAVYRDTDRDGLPDRLERAVGTDPALPDSNGNGIPDDRDKNLAFQPHPLSDQEGIYQATLEGLCQLARTAPTTREPYDHYGALPWLGGAATPLSLPLPPGSRGIELRGSPVAVVFARGASAIQRAGELRGSAQFIPPHFELDGTRNRESWWQRPAPLLDPFQAETTSRKAPEPSFREIFPYELSADRRRARVGWLQQPLLGRVSVVFDVEVRKLGDRWYPVECRQVYASWGLFSDGSLASPVRRFGKRDYVVERAVIRNAAELR